MNQQLKLKNTSLKSVRRGVFVRDPVVFCVPFAQSGGIRIIVGLLVLRDGGLFLRCHQSYPVNPHCIRSIRRFQVTLTDGTVLPVPEKKYTAFKKAVIPALKH